MTASGGFKACYRHPKRPAIKNCQYCDRPICRECELESGDHRLCGPCKKKLLGTAAPPTRPPADQPPPLVVGELTVSDEGVVIDAPTRPPQDPAAPREPGGNDAAPVSTDAAPASNEIAPSSLEPSGEEERQERAVLREAEREAEGTFLRRIIPGRRKERQPGHNEEAEPERPGIRQVAYALPFAVMTAVLVSGAWLLIAILLEQWTQISVLTLGLAVPWVFYNFSTRKKRAGVQVWSEAPVVLVSAFSLALVAVAALLLEFLVYRLVFSGFMKAGLFGKEYFGAFGWTMIALGLASVLVTPFALKLGGGRDVPRLRLKRRRRVGV